MRLPAELRHLCTGAAGAAAARVLAVGWTRSWRGTKTCCRSTRRFSGRRRQVRLVRLDPCACMVLWQINPHVWLGSIRPRSQCVGGMLLVQWCYKHVLNGLRSAHRRPGRGRPDQQLRPGPRPGAGHRSVGVDTGGGRRWAEAAAQAPGGRWCWQRERRQRRRRRRRRRRRLATSPAAAAAGVGRTPPAAPATVAHDTCRATTGRCWSADGRPRGAKRPPRRVATGLHRRGPEPPGPLMPAAPNSSPCCHTA